MRRIAYMAILMLLLVLLGWPRPIATPPASEPATSTRAAGDGDDAAVTDDEAPDSATDVSDFLLETIPSTLPPPSDQGLLQDLEQAVDEIPGAQEIARDPIEIRPDFAPLLPPVQDDSEPETEPDP